MVPWVASVDKACGGVGGHGDCAAGCCQTRGCRLAGGLGVAVPLRKRVVAGNMWGFCARPCSPLSSPPIKKPIHLVLLAPLHLLRLLSIFHLLLVLLRVHQSSLVVWNRCHMLGSHVTCHPHVKTSWNHDCHVDHIISMKYWNGSSWDWCTWPRHSSTNHMYHNGRAMGGQW